MQAGGLGNHRHNSKTLGLTTHQLRSDVHIIVNITEDSHVFSADLALLVFSH